MTDQRFLSIRNLVRRYGGLTVTNDLTLDVALGETHALIGPNGAGKTTLIAQIQGELASNAGRIQLAGYDITKEPPHRRAKLGIARTFQITSIFPEFSVLINIAFAKQASAGHSLHFWKPVEQDTELLYAARAAAIQVGLEPRLKDAAHNLSHGERRQLELAMALVTRPRLLLLDEPMAGMGRQDCTKVERLLRDLKKDYTMLLVEHDMDAVFALADRITVLVAGRAIATGTPDQIRANSKVRDAYLGHTKTH